MIALSYPVLYRTAIPVPKGATPLPGPLTILNRPAAGGSPPPTASEALSGIKKVEYRNTMGYDATISIPPTADPGNPPVQAHTYATNPRKDATTPKLSSSYAFANAYAAAQARLIASRKGATTTGNNTGKSPSLASINRAAATNKAGVALTADQAAATSPNPSGAFHWTALLILGGIAFFVLRK